MFDYLVAGLLCIAGGGMADYKYQYEKNLEAFRWDQYAKHTVEYGENSSKASLYKNAAEAELKKNGKTQNYQLWKLSESIYTDQANNNATQQTAYSNTANDARHDANTYRIVSLSLYSVGGVFLIKAYVDHVKAKRETRLSRVMQNIDVAPNGNFDGAQAKYTYKFGR